MMGAMKRGFTLMEIMITVVILGMILSFALPGFLNAMEKNMSVEATSTLITLLGAERRWSLDNAGAFTNNINNLDIQLPALSNFCAPVLNTVNPIVSLGRKSNAGDCVGIQYTLAITSAGVVSCANGTSTICGKLGY